MRPNPPKTYFKQVVTKDICQWKLLNIPKHLKFFRYFINIADDFKLLFRFEKNESKKLFEKFSVADYIVKGFECNDINSPVRMQIS